MARYIDAEKLCKSLRDMAFYQNPYKQSTILGVVSSIENFPTADVAPKSEVASMPHKCKDCAGCTQWKCDCSLIEDNAKTEVAREIFEEIEEIAIEHEMFGRIVLMIGQGTLAELKKKYTGEQT